MLANSGGPLAKRILQTLVDVDKAQQRNQVKSASAAARAIDLLRYGNQSAVSLAIDNGHVGECSLLLQASV